jgi:anti-repressor protein
MKATIYNDFIESKVCQPSNRNDTILIAIQKTKINDEEVNCVDARELWYQIESKQDFSTWIKNRLEDYNENQDFIRFHKKMEANNATMIEYYLTIEVAKHIAMMERNAQGKKVRDYFIKCEKKLKETNLPKKINSTFLLQIVQEMQKQENLIAEQQYKIEAQDSVIEKISNTQDSYSIRESKCKLMVEENQLKEFLKSKKWIQYLSDGIEGKKAYSTAYSKESGFAIDKAVLKKATQTFYHQCRITNKGMDYLIKHREEILTF